MEDLSFLVADDSSGAEDAAPSVDPLAFLNPDPALGDAVFKMQSAEPLWHDLGDKSQPDVYELTPASEVPDLPNVAAPVAPTSMALTTPATLGDFKNLIRELEKREIYASAECTRGDMWVLYARTTGDRGAALELKRAAWAHRDAVDKEIAAARVAFKDFSTRGSVENVDPDEARRLHYLKLYSGAAD